MSPLPPGEVVARFLGALGTASADIPRSVDAAAARFRSLLDGRRVLLVLDNAADASQIRPLLPGSPTCAVVVTSRRILAAVDGAIHLHLDVLTEDEATTLLGRLAGVHRIAAEPKAAERIARACGYVPLALRIAGARLAARPHWPLGVLADKLGDARHRLDELHFDDLAVRTSFSVGYHDLQAAAHGHQAARMFRLLGLYPGPDIGVPAAAALAGLHAQHAESVLESLVDSHLLESHHCGRYRLHDLLRCYAAERASADELDSDQTKAIHRMLTWFLHTADAVDRRLAPGRDHVPLDPDPTTDCQPLAVHSPTEALQWCHIEHRNLVAATQCAADRGRYDLAWRIPVALGVAFEQCNPRADAITLGEIAVTSARQIDDRYGLARALNTLGNAYGTLGKFDAAIRCHQESLAASRDIGYRRGESTCLTNLGAWNQYQGKMQQAIDYYLPALRIAHEEADPYSECIVLSSLGEACHGLSRFDEAIDYYTQALADHRIAFYPLHKGALLAYLGLSYAAMGSWREAIACCSRSLKSHRTHKNRYGEAETLITLADILTLRSRHDDAKNQQNKARHILDELKSPATDRLRTRLPRPCETEVDRPADSPPDRLRKDPTPA